MPHIVHRDDINLKNEHGTGWERLDLIGESISSQIGANFELLILEAGQATPMHQHEDCEHYLFVLEGRGFLELEGVEHPIGPNYLISVEPGERHAVRNSDQKRLEILEFLITGSESSPSLE
jgi:mannose-6-phosphate isomerase-like protein (cupin superfamily)